MVGRAVPSPNRRYRRVWPPRTKGQHLSNPYAQHQLKLIRHTGALILWQQRTYVVSGTREQCEAAYKSAQTYNLLVGWWSLVSLLAMNWIALISNFNAIRRVRAAADGRPFPTARTPSPIQPFPGDPYRRAGIQTRPGRDCVTGTVRRGPTGPIRHVTANVDGCPGSASSSPPCTAGDHTVFCAVTWLLPAYPGGVHPEAGLHLPGVAFGHDWLTGTSRYSGLLEHLASWGIVAAAPDSERGLAPSVLNLAFDLGVALDIVAGVRLGPGKISVHPAKLGLVGHGFGGSAAVFAAAGLTGTHVKSVAAIFPTVTNPAAEQPAATLDVPGLILTAPGDPKTLTSNALGLSRAWDKATLRIVSKARAGGLVEGRRLTKVLGLPGPHRRTQRSVRALLTGYLLYTLGGDKTYRRFADPDLQLPKTDPIDPEAPPITPGRRS